ncbi:uncharacterized protein LOC107861985 isoform X2 [Capsicum annuum]|uniref:uncharacterized protein LOC107861985 isoform X2 n=1 Tax=Capsicum annuum TaxID=4072 RepID=UPI001FB1381A|nr:uncharacterized protein LOC107861985 isoform X2 [Capsicum annuum]
MHGSNIFAFFIIGPSLPGSSKLPANDNFVKLLGKDPIMTDMKRCEKEKNGKIGWNDGAQFSSTSARDSPEASEEDVAAAEALLELGYAVSISKNSNLPESSKRPCKRKNFLSQEEGKSTDDVCSERVDVHGYRVLACSAPILDAIFAKYGDIAENCHNKSPYTRGFLLDVVCDAVRELKTGAVRSSSVKAMKDIASVAKDANVDVTWLQQYLNEISEDEEMERTRRAEFLNSLFPTSSS